ncbi:class I SAM-dependent methyltransferase [Skermanella mucosa]|uniref:methyltransferase domain-containing protein n=1 Tax=Skermanella mucosa TaxID=1789672 RepID=UPI001E542982|nr:class I SAM-dependent methyltransferase [Skermanella mucosa]UEM22660.1 class I SAM-dependent methyltransferase [Skermanella mucosa]
MDSWIDFWNRPNAIYVNQRNVDAHFDCIVRDLREFVPPGGGKVVLDFGCGDALGASRVADGCETLYLYDAAPTVRERVRERLAGDRRIKVLDGNGLRHLPAASVDLVLVVSVVQYMARDELSDALRLWHHILKPDGALIIADVIDPATPIHVDVRSQLAFARKSGFLLAALGGLVRMFFSNYRDLRNRAGFAMYRQEEMLGILRSGGFEGTVLSRNIGPGTHRQAFRARKQSKQARAAAE